MSWTSTRPGRPLERCCCVQISRSLTTPITRQSGSSRPSWLGTGVLGETPGLGLAEVGLGPHDSSPPPSGHYAKSPVTQNLAARFGKLGFEVLSTEMVDGDWHVGIETPRNLVVRGHGKVPVDGQVGVPGGGQVEVPAPRSSCRSGACALGGDRDGSSQSRHHPGSSIEACVGTNEYRCCLTEVGTYRGAAEICGTTHKTVKRVIERAEAGEAAVVVRAERPRNYDAVTDMVTKRVEVVGGPDLGEAVVAGRPGRRV